MNRTDGPDFGTFTVSFPNLQGVLDRLQELAATNQEYPGQAHAEVSGKDKRTGRTTATQTWHLDQTRGVLCVVESIGGKLTARKTMPLASLAPDEPAGPPQPETGPETASFERRPFFGADVDIEDELRDWVKEQVQTDSLGAAAVPARIRLFGGTRQDVLVLPRPLLPASLATMGATLAALRMRVGVARCFAEGWIDQGDERGMAFVLERGEDEAWWAATRFFRRKPGPVLEWIAPWREQEGEGPSALPVELRSVRWSLASAKPLLVGEPSAPPEPSVQMAPGTFGPNWKMPPTAEALADEVGRSFETEARGKAGPPAGQRVLVIRGRDWERWEIEGEAPVDLDDLVRAACKRGAAPDAVVVVQQALVPIDGATARALVTQAELGLNRHTRCMEFRLNAVGRIATWRLLRGPSGPIEREDAWIGNDPVTDFDWVVLGKGEA